MTNISYISCLTQSCTFADVNFTVFKCLLRFHCTFVIVVCHAAINPKQPLPPPKWAAVELKQQAVDAIKQWHDSFGKTYKKLSVAYDFLKSSKKVGFLEMHYHS